MKRKELYFLLGAALVLAIAGTIFEIAQSSAWKGAAAAVEPFAKLPINSVEKLVITSSKDKVTLQKVNDVWTVAERNGYPADFNKIRRLMTSLWDFKVVRQLDVGPSQFGRLNIVAPGQGDDAGVGLDLSDAGGKPIKSLIFGKPLGGENSNEDEEGKMPGAPKMPRMPSADGADGRFVYDPSEKDKVYLGGENFSTVDASPKSWLNKDFIRDNRVKEVERESSAGSEGWTLTRKDEKTGWELAGAKPGETPIGEAGPSVSVFSPNFVDVKPANTPDSETGFDKAVTVNVQTFDGFKYALEIGGEAPDQSHFFRFKVSADLPATRTAEPNESPDDKKKKDDEFAKQQETLKNRLAAEQKLQNWIFEVENYAVEIFFKSRKDLLQGPSPTPSPRPAVNRPSVPLPLAATPNPTVSPAPEVPSPSPESSATPEVTATPQATPSPETTPTAEAVPSSSPTPETTPSPEAASSSPSPSPTPGT